MYFVLLLQCAGEATSTTPGAMMSTMLSFEPPQNCRDTNDLTDIISATASNPTVHPTFCECCSLLFLYAHETRLSFENVSQ
ncbi:hypothetical protein F5888DRAFT_1667616 [Russula emetica]|nr:hypothetical protein F5888DRAFT_1667616 [Russula emetica]